MKHEKSCGAIVYKKDNDDIEFLLIKHVKGHWSFPKGHVEYNESEEETAFREIKEETNLETTINNNFRYVVSYSPCENVIKDVVYFLATPKTYELIPQVSEVSEIVWLNECDTLNTITYENDKGVFLEVLKYMKKN